MIEEPHSDAAQIAEAVMTMFELARQIGESAQGYRQNCIEVWGFGEEAAEEMAVDMHKALMQLLLRSK